MIKDGEPTDWGLGFGPAGRNAGSLVYAHFEKVVRDAFYWWRLLPDPAEFDKYIEFFEGAAWTIGLTSRGSTVTGVGNTKMTAVSYLYDKVVGDEMKGQTIQTFAQHVVAPLPVVIHAQYALTLLSGATLRGKRRSGRRRGRTPRRSSTAPSRR